MNIELDEVLVEDFSDDALEQVAGGANVAIPTDGPCYTGPRMSC